MQGGTANVPFTYRIVTRRKDIEGKRFARVSTEAAEKVAGARAVLAAMGTTGPASGPSAGPPPARPHQLRRSRSYRPWSPTRRPSSRVAPARPSCRRAARQPHHQTLAADCRQIVDAERLTRRPQRAERQVSYNLASCNVLLHKHEKPLTCSLMCSARARYRLRRNGCKRQTHGPGAGRRMDADARAHRDADTADAHTHAASDTDASPSPAATARDAARRRNRARQHGASGDGADLRLRRFGRTDARDPRRFTSCARALDVLHHGQVGRAIPGPHAPHRLGARHRQPQLLAPGLRDDDGRADSKRDAARRAGA